MSQKKLLLFVEDLKLSLESGLTIIEALEISGENTEDSDILKRCKDMHCNLKKGENLTTSWNLSFPEEINETGNLLSIYEESGAISQGFGKIASYLQERIYIKKKLFKKLYYPSFVFLLSVGVLIWFINFFIPSMIEMLKDVLVAEEYYKLTNVFKKIRLGVNGSAVFSLLFALYLCISKRGREKTLKKLYKIKIFRKIISTFYLEAFSNHFFHLIKSGFSVIKILDILKKDSFFKFCWEDTNECIRIILKGQPLSVGMKGYSFIGKKEIEIIKKGELRGTLEEAFDNINKYSKKKKNFYFSEMLSYSEPFIIIFAGIISGVSVYMFYKILFSFTFTLI